VEEGDCVFEEGSLSMDEYLGEFTNEMIRFRNNRCGAGNRK
jgi:archaeosine synthase alpha-subunit